MFTGLIEDVGIVQQMTKNSGGGVITIRTELPLSEVNIGDSIAVDGACLTVVRLSGKEFSADASPETLSCTTLSGLRTGSRVNLERALRFGDRLGGHLVTGHVDSLARIVSRNRDGNMEEFIFAAEPATLRLLVAKGSVAIDGISLTVNRVEKERFSVAIIPHTLAETTLEQRQVGDQVNIETDLIGKYVARLVETRDEKETHSKMDADFLARHGFM